MDKYLKSCSKALYLT